MAEVRIGTLSTQVDVTDENALLSPRVLARIVAAVEEQMTAKARAEESRRADTRIGGQGGRT